MSEEIFNLLNENIEFSRQTGSSFSPLLGGLIKLWNINEPETREPPGKEAVDEARSHTDLSNLILNSDSKTITLLDPQSELNLGASAKGFAADKLKEELKAQGVSSGIINLGGNVLLIGERDGGDFHVGIDNPDLADQSPIAVLNLRDKSVVTSGSYQRYFTGPDGTIYHHLLDPATGYPANSGLVEVVVVSDSSLTGDMLSTALFVMGESRGREFLKTYDSGEDIGVIFVTNDKKILVSDNLKDNFTLEPDYEKVYSVEYFSE